MNEDEMKLVKMLLDNFWCNRQCGQDAQEILGLNPEHPDNPSNDWIDDVATELTKTMKEVSA